MGTDAGRTPPTKHHTPHTNERKTRIDLGISLNERWTVETPFRWGNCRNFTFFVVHDEEVRGRYALLKTVRKTDMPSDDLYRWRRRALVAGTCWWAGTGTTRIGGAHEPPLGREPRHVRPPRRPLPGRAHRHGRPVPRY